MNHDAKTGLPGHLPPSGGYGGRAPDVLATSGGVVRLAIGLIEHGLELHDDGQTLAGDGEIRNGIKLLKQLDLDHKRPLPSSTDKALRTATDYFRTRGTIEAALAFAALHGMVIAELDSLSIGQQEQFCHRMAELVRAYRCQPRVTR